MKLPPSSVAADAEGSAKFSAPAAFVPRVNRAMPEATAASKFGSFDSPGTQMFTVSQACYLIKQLCWSIRGTASLEPGQSVIIRRATRHADGTVCVGSTIGTVAVSPGGKWEFLQSGLAQMPDGATYVHVSTLQGGGRTAPLSIDL